MTPNTTTICKAAVLAGWQRRSSPNALLDCLGAHDVRRHADAYHGDDENARHRRRDVIELHAGIGDQGGRDRENCGVNVEFSWDHPRFRSSEARWWPWRNG